MAKQKTTQPSRRPIFIGLGIVGFLALSFVALLLGMKSRYGSIFGPGGNELML